jgi:hypothetical protein
VHGGAVGGGGGVNPSANVQAGLPACLEYSSLIYYHSNSPEWRETIKVVVPPELYEKAHIRFNFRHCTSKSAPGKKKDEIFCFAFQRLVDPGKSTHILDKMHQLSLYKYEPKWYVPGSVSYLRARAGV